MNSRGCDLGSSEELTGIDVFHKRIGIAGSASLDVFELESERPLDGGDYSDTLW